MAKIIVPAVTAWNDNGKPDIEATKQIIDFLIAGGVDGVLVLGSTGEFTALSLQEKKVYLKAYADYVDGRMELYAGTGCINYDETLELSNAVYEMGYRASFVIGPCYYGMNDEQIFTYYDQLAKNLKGDMYIYNYPERSGHSVDAPVVRRLVESNKNIIGLKDTVQSPSHTNAICQATKDVHFEVYSGFDDQFFYNLCAGGSGSIGGLANILPEVWSDLIRSANQKNYERAIQISGLLYRLMPIYTQNISCSLLFKKLMAARGVKVPETAMFPYDEDGEAAYQKIKEIMDQVLEAYHTLPLE